MTMNARHRHCVKSQMLPKLLPGQRKKDLATPRLATMSMVDRLRKRKRSLRADVGTKIRQTYLKSLPHMNKISKLLTDKVKAVTRQDRYLYNKAILGSKERWPSAQASYLARRTPCNACHAPTSDLCICAGLVYKFLVVKELQNFVAGYRAPENPCHVPQDPEDQEEIQRNMEKVLGRTFTRSSSSFGKCKQIVRLSYLAAMTGSPNTVDAAGELAALGKYTALRKQLESMEVVHRGGQHPGPVFRHHLADGLEDFMITLGEKLALSLQKCTSRTNQFRRQEHLYVLVNALKLCGYKQENGVDGISAYKAKKIAEMIILVGLSNRILCCHIKLPDLLCLFGAWPLPGNSKDAHLKIYPGLRTDKQHQQALRAVSLSIGFGGNNKSVAVCSVSAMLCFWQEHVNGVLDWVPVWSK